MAVFSSSGIPRAAREIGSTGNDSDYLIMPLDCCQILSTPHVGVNPRGIRPLQSGKWMSRIFPPLGEINIYMFLLTPALV